MQKLSLAILSFSGALLFSSVNFAQSVVYQGDHQYKSAEMAGIGHYELRPEVAEILTKGIQLNGVTITKVMITLGSSEEVDYLASVLKSNPSAKVVVDSKVVPEAISKSESSDQVIWADDPQYVSLDLGNGKVLNLTDHSYIRQVELATGRYGKAQFQKTKDEYACVGKISQDIDTCHAHYIK